jgi:hypothetical protein
MLVLLISIKEYEDWEVSSLNWRIMVPKKEQK